MPSDLGARVEHRGPHGPYWISEHARMHVQMHRCPCPRRTLMRLRHPNGRIVHLGYEIAPRPARRVAEVVAQLDKYAAVRTMIGADSLGVSLWLPPALAAAL